MSGLPAVIVFDLDDTLIEEEPARDAALEATAARLRDRGVEPVVLRDAVRLHARELWWAHPLHEFAYGIGVASWEALWARFEGDGDELTVLRHWAPEYRREAWRRALADVGVDDESEAAALAESFPVERRARHRPYPDAEPVLRALSRRDGVRIGLLTNGLSCLQREKLAGSGLESFFEAVVAGGDVGSRKPETVVFDHVVRRLGARPGEALMIGNNPETDIAGARRAGLDAVLVARDGLPVRSVPPDLSDVPVVPDLVTWARRCGVPVDAEAVSPSATCGSRRGRSA